MGELYCCVETPKGSQLSGNNALHDVIECPADCGYFPQTIMRPGRPLAAIVCASTPHSAGGMIAVKPIALLRMRDHIGYDEFVVCVALDDSAWSTVNRIGDLPAQLRREIEAFIATRPGARDAPIVGWRAGHEALAAIDDAAARWAATVNGRA